MFLIFYNVLTLVLKSSIDMYDYFPVIKYYARVKSILQT